MRAWLLVVAFGLPLERSAPSDPPSSPVHVPVDAASLSRHLSAARPSLLRARTQRMHAPPALCRALQARPSQLPCPRRNKIPMHILVEAFLDDKVAFKKDVFKTLDEHREDFIDWRPTWNLALFLIRQAPRSTLAHPHSHTHTRTHAHAHPHTHTRSHTPLSRIRTLAQLPATPSSPRRPPLLPHLWRPRACRTFLFRRLWRVCDAPAACPPGPPLHLLLLQVDRRHKEGDCRPLRHGQRLFRRRARRPPGGARLGSNLGSSRSVSARLGAFMGPLMIYTSAIYHGTLPTPGSGAGAPSPSLPGSVRRPAPDARAGADQQARHHLREAAPQARPAHARHRLRLGDVGAARGEPLQGGRLAEPRQAAAERVPNKERGGRRRAPSG